MNYTRKQIAIAVGAVILVVLAVVLFAGNNKADAAGQDKVGVCHRTASETNPYVYIEVPEDEANGHITGTDKQHNEKVTWKSDGTWRGVPHAAGDLKLDYYASSRLECEDTVPTTPTETPTTPTETPTTTPPAPTETPSTTPPAPTQTPEPEDDTDNGGGNQPNGTDNPPKDVQVTECIDGVFVTSVNGEVISESGTCDESNTQRQAGTPTVAQEEGL